jgi:hypothetical protein
MQKRAMRFWKVATLAAVPLVIIWAHSLPPLSYTGAPGDSGTCANCHGGAGGSGSVVITSTSGMTNYMPGASKHFTVTVSGSGGNAGFELTARPASNLTGGVAGNFVATDTTTQVVCRAGTTCSGGNPQYIRSLAGTATPAVFNFDWTAPSSTENVTFYIAGAVGYSGNTYTASYTLTASGGVGGPTLTPTSTSLGFGSYTLGGAVPPPGSISITSTNPANGLAFTAALGSDCAWLTLPAFGSTPATLSASINAAAVVAGSHSCNITFNASGVSPSPTLTATMTAVANTPSLQITPTSLSFTFETGNRAPIPYVINVASSTILNYTATTSGADWLSLAPASGATPGTLFVSVNPASLAAGTHNASITIASSDSPSNPQTVPVTLAVSTGTNACLVPPPVDH